MDSKKLMKKITCFIISFISFYKIFGRTRKLNYIENFIEIFVLILENIFWEIEKKNMPQIDKVTFLTTVYWTFIFYFFLYLDLSVTYFYKFFTTLKFKTQRMCWVYRNLQINTLRARLLSSGAWF